MSDADSITTLQWLLLTSLSIWIFFDATKIGVKKGQVSGIADMSPIGWLLGCLVLWIIVFPLYLIKRSEFIRINSADTIASIPQQARNKNPKLSLSMDEKVCPYCTELIKQRAIVCRFCGRDLPANKTSSSIRN